MDSGGSGISWKYTTSGNDYKKPDVQATASGSGQYRHGTVRKVNVPPSYIQKRNECHPASDACSANHPPGHSVKPVHGFNALITPEKMDWLAGVSARYGDLYDGRNHGQFACSIKRYTSGSKRPLNYSEQRQLIPLLHDFKVTPRWSWRSLTTTLHSLTSADVLTPHKYIDEGGKETQAALLSNLLDAVIFKCNQKPEARDIDAQGISNLLWALAKMVDNGLELEKTPKLKEAVAALLPHAKTNAESKEEKDHCIPQQIANQLWAVAKLVDNGLELVKTPKLKEVVAALLPQVKTKAESKKEKDHFKPQEVANLLWAVTKLVDNGLKLEKTPKLKEAVAALLPHVKTKAESKEEKDHFNTQATANLLWALAKLVDNGLELKKTAQFKEALAALLSRVKNKAESKEDKGLLISQHIVNLLWALAKLVDNGLKLEKTPKLKEAVAALLPYVKTKAESKEEKDDFKPQGIVNLLWALAKLVDNGLKLAKTPKIKEAVAELLPHVKTKAEAKEEKNQLIPQHIANLLWALAKLVDNGLEKTAKLKEAVAALLPHVKINADSKEEKDDFKPQGITNLLWAVAKLVDNGLEPEKTAPFKEVVAALLLRVKTKAESKEEKDHFNTQAAANLLWALATLLNNGLELEKTAKLKETLAALLSPVITRVDSKEEKDRFTPQHIANLLWAVAKLGEAIELNRVKSTFYFLVDRIRKNPQLSQQDISMSLWGIMAFCARSYLDSGSNNKHPLEKHIGELSSRLENTFPDNTEDQSIIAMAAGWLGRVCPVIPYYTTNTSQSQSTFRDHLQSSFPSLKIEEEKSLNSLPPVDLLLPDYNMVIDIQGPFHYVSGDFKTRNGSTLLKIGLLQKLGFEVIEIPVNKLRKQDSMKIVIEQIKARLAVSPEAYGSVSLNSDEWVADEAYFTADDGGQFSDDCYFTAEEYSEEQTGKPKRKRKRKKLVKTHLHKH
ncbi:RAP domain-containing protein [Endozoicomonas acroporae]|uniref:RAP domain-containing protein n=1 Tax=Endozoicomonas acroporae TaxID=1701104 RepID=UPI003D7AA2BD